jgi:hypothetical protein
MDEGMRVKPTRRAAESLAMTAMEIFIARDVAAPPARTAFAHGH